MLDRTTGSIKEASSAKSTKSGVRYKFRGRQRKEKGSGGLRSSKIFRSLWCLAGSPGRRRLDVLVDGVLL
jgi:hypothetical protein